MDQFYRLVDEAYQKRDWETLGYNSRQDYVDSELGISRQRSYQLLNQAKVERALEEASISCQRPLTPDEEPLVGVNEWQARFINPHLPDMVEEVRRAVANGTDPQQANQVIDKYRAPSPSREWQSWTQTMPRIPGSHFSYKRY